MTKPTDVASLQATLLDYVADRLTEKIVARLDEYKLKAPPALLDRAALARELRVSKPTIDRLRREGCPTVWVGGSPRFELDRVLAFLRQNRPNPRRRRIGRGSHA